MYIDKSKQKCGGIEFCDECIYGNPCFSPSKNSIFASLDIRDPQEAFDNAIKHGLKDPENWMYMYTSNNHDYFKNIVSRNYIHFKRSDK